MVRGLVWMFMRKKQQRVWRYPAVSPDFCVLPTFDAVHIDALADI